MSEVVIGDVPSQLDFDREDAPVSTFDDQVDFVLTRGRSEMLRARLGCLRVNADVERNERLEEGAEERPVSMDRGADGFRLEQCARVEAQQSSGERRVDKLMLW